MQNLITANLILYQISVNTLLSRYFHRKKIDAYTVLFKLQLPSNKAEGILIAFFKLLESCSCTFCQQPWAHLHSLYGLDNLHFLLFNLVNSCGNMQCWRIVSFMFNSAIQSISSSSDQFILDLWMHIFLFYLLELRVPSNW